MRVNFLIVFFILLFSFTGYKIFDLSINQYGFFSEIAASQKSYGFQSSALRGEILIKDGLNGQLTTLATNRPVSASFDLYSRFYPEGGLVSSVVGFLGFQDKNRIGQYGLEEYYEPWLSGQVGLSDFLNKAGLSGGANPGSSLILTIDKNIQFLIEAKLEELVKKWGATGGSVIIQDPQSGAILAMANYPDFDPNEYSGYSLENFVNPNIQNLFEPGSSFKAITMAAALDSGAVTPQ